MTVRVCFVCLGNICRSPTAEVVFRKHVEAAGLSHRFDIDSAGTGGWHAGEPAHPETRATARRHGLEITHRARVFTAKDFERFDWILALDTDNRRAILELAPDDAARAKVHMLRAFEADAEVDAIVPDPYYNGRFELVVEICERACGALLSRIRTAHAL